MVNEDIIFQIILHGGNARAEAYQALNAARQGDFAAAQTHLAQAGREVAIAHRIQADIIQKEAGGEKTEVTLLVVHAQDHLMTAIAEKSLIENMITLHARIKALEDKGRPAG